MTLVSIDDSKEPICLKELRENSQNTYNDLQLDCRKEVIAELKAAQNNLCAYCQKNISDVMTIEHYLSQSEYPNEVLSFSNYLGVCSGKFYIDKKTGKHIEHCDTRRGDIKLNIDPRVQEHIDSVSYDDQGRITSDDLDIKSDLDETLNLNFDEICQKRNDHFKEFLVLIDNQGKAMDLNKIQILKRAKVVLNSTFPEYYGYLKYRLEKLL